MQFCGGEPLLARSLLPLAQRARQVHLPTRVLSNGIPVTDALAGDLRRSGVGIVQVSLDGGREIHDAIRGEGAFDRAAAGARLLVGAELELTIAATLSRLNLDQIDAVLTTAVDLGAERVAFSRLVPSGAGAELLPELLSAAQWLDAQVTMIELARRRGIALMPRDPTFNLLLGFQPGPPGRLGGCAAGANGLSVEPDGTVYPCRRLPIAIGNVFEDDLEEIWRAPLLEQLRDRDELGGACGRCRLRWACGGCRAVAYGVTGDPMAEDPQCPLRAAGARRAWSRLRQRWHRFVRENL